MTFVLRVAILNKLILKDMNCTMSGESHGKPIEKGNHRSIDCTVPTHIVGDDKLLKAVVRHLYSGIARKTDQGNFVTTLGQQSEYIQP